MAYGQAIIKFVNYADNANSTRAERLSKYLQLLERTDEDLITGNYIDKKNVAHGLEVIEKNFNPRGHRSFKQGIISAGVSCKEFSPTEFLELMSKLLTDFFKGYPYLAAVHTNKPKHLHSHFLLGMTNVLTGKKFSQSKRDLQNFKDYYDELAKQYNLPLIKTIDSPQKNLVEEKSKVGDKVEEIVVERSPPIIQTEPQMNIFAPKNVKMSETALQYYAKFRDEDNDCGSEKLTIIPSSSGQSTRKYVKNKPSMTNQILVRFNEDYKTWFEIGREWSK